MQTRKFAEDFNESRTLAFLIYSHFIFALLRVASFGLSGSVSEVILSNLRSIVYSMDTIATILIYFVPKLTAQDSSSSSVVSGLSGSQVAPSQRSSRFPENACVTENEDKTDRTNENQKPYDVPDDGSDNDPGSDSPPTRRRSSLVRFNPVVMEWGIDSIQESDASVCSECGQSEGAPLMVDPEGDG